MFSLRRPYLRGNTPGPVQSSLILDQAILERRIEKPMAEDFAIRVDYESSKDPVIHIQGEITSEADEDIVETYNGIPATKRNRIIINFERTSYINSAGIATLISLISKANDSQAKIEFAGLNDHFKKVMDIVGLTDFVIIHNSLSEALQ